MLCVWVYPTKIRYTKVSVMVTKVFRFQIKHNNMMCVYVCMYRHTQIFTHLCYAYTHILMCVCMPVHMYIRTWVIRCVPNHLSVSSVNAFLFYFPHFHLLLVTIFAILPENKRFTCNLHGLWCGSKWSNKIDYSLSKNDVRHKNKLMIPS